MGYSSQPQGATLDEIIEDLLPQRIGLIERNRPRQVPAIRYRHTRVEELKNVPVLVVNLPPDTLDEIIKDWFPKRAGLIGLDKMHNVLALYYAEAERQQVEKEKQHKERALAVTLELEPDGDSQKEPDLIPNGSVCITVIFRSFRTVEANGPNSK